MSKSTFSGAVLILGAAAILALVFTAGVSNAQNANSSTTGSANPDGHGAGRKMTADHKFVMFAAMGGMAEVELGRLAAAKGASEDVRQFGQRMVDDHSKANDELMSVASSKGIQPPAALDAKHQAAVQKLSALSGEKFDREYAKMMVADHKKTVSEFQKEADRGADADVKAFAASKLPALQEHLRMAQRLNDKLALRKSGNLKTMNDNTGGSTNANTSNTNNSNR
jgi:putative membrane protein